MFYKRREEKEEKNPKQPLPPLENYIYLFVTSKIQKITSTAGPQCIFWVGEEFAFLF